MNQQPTERAELPSSIPRREAVAVPNSAAANDFAFLHTSASSLHASVYGPGMAPVTGAPPVVKTANGAAPGRRTMEEMESLLEEYLALPSPHPVLFYVMDKLAGLARDLGRLPSTEDLLAAQQKTDSLAVAQIRAALVTAWNHGLLRLFANGAIEVTAGGHWYIREGRARRLALWKINQALEVSVVCAIVILEEGDGPVLEVPVELVDAAPLRDQAIAEDAEPETESQAAPARRGRPPKKVHGLWAGLLAPIRPMNAEA